MDREQLIILLVLGVFAFGKWLFTNAGSRSDPPSRSSGGGTPGPSSPSPIRRQPIPGRDESEEERIRRFMEALGLPPDATPPQALQRPSASPAPAVAPVPAARPRRPALRKPTPMGGPNPWDFKPQPQMERERPAEPPAAAPKPISQPPSRPQFPQPPQPIPAGSGSGPLFPEAVPASEALPSIALSSAEDLLPPQAEALFVEGIAPQMELITPASAGSAQDRVEISNVRARLRGRAALREAFILKEILGPPKAFSS